jgi:hypothetical protein
MSGWARGGHPLTPARFAVKLAVVDPSPLLPHPGAEVSEVLIDLRPTLTVDHDTLTVEVKVSDLDAHRAGTRITTMLKRAGIPTAARITEVVELEP